MNICQSFLSSQVPVVHVKLILSNLTIPLISLHYTVICTCLQDYLSKSQEDIVTLTSYSTTLTRILSN